MRADLPTGTVTFLFTDVEGSTRLLQELGADAYAAVLGEHRRLVREACAAHSGVEVDTQGDAFFFAFPTAPGAVDAALAVTSALAGGPIQVRIGVHTGSPLATEEGYVGDDVHIAARVADAGHGRQILVSAATASLLESGGSAPLVALGEHRLKDVHEPVGIYQVGSHEFPPLRTVSNTNLPTPASSFVGRAEEVRTVLSKVEAGARLVTLTGPGGTGKTRLAIEAASALVPSYAAGVYWVGLESVRDAALVPETISTTLGARNGLAEHIGDRRLLLLLDNLEQVVEAAPRLAELVERCPNLTVLVTSREVLRVQGEVEYAVPPLAEPEAVSLFCERSGLEPSDEIAELCARLDSLPLAVELAAARARALSPRQILERISGSLDLLSGRRDADPRQRTLRATIAWSYELLSAEEKRLLARLSVFSGGCTLEAAEAVCEADVDGLQSLVEKSLLRFSNERYGLLETIREFAAEQLDERKRDAVRRRHRAYMVELARLSATLLHTAAESRESARLAPDYANFRAAVWNALEAGEPDDIGRMLGAVYPYLITYGHPAEVSEWAAAVLRQRDRLSAVGLAETLVAAGEFARFAGDLDRAIELKEELAEVENGDLQRPNWRAATLADLSEIAIDQGHYDAARQYAERSAEEGGGARVGLCLAELGLRTGDLESARAHALAALAGLDEGSFNHACGLEILGEIVRRSGDEDEASALFASGLRAFAELRDGGGVSDCLDGLARLALAGGDPERAGRLRGAAERMRDEHGRRPIRTDTGRPDGPASATAEGRAFSFDEAVAYALSSID
jgi:predicted ATPase/class 3 adenylate cyclase